MCKDYNYIIAHFIFEHYNNNFIINYIFKSERCVKLNLRRQITLTQSFFKVCEFTLILIKLNCLSLYLLLCCSLYYSLLYSYMNLN